jgi:hypothetical protein
MKSDFLGIFKNVLRRFYCIWQQPTQIKTPFVKNLRAVRSQGMLAIIQCRMLCLPGCYPKTQRLGYTVLPVGLYECETWSLTLREEQRLRVFENRMLRRIFGPKRDEATGAWRRLHNEELNNLTTYIIRVIKSRRMRWAGHVAHTGGKGGAFTILVGRPEECDHLGDPG